MTDPPASAPDLKNGHIINGVGAPNSWMTEIQSALSIGDEDGERMLYLSHECRAEDVPFSSSNTGGEKSIFQKDNIIEFLTFADNRKTLQLSTNEISYVEHEKNQSTPNTARVCVPEATEITHSESRVSCAKRPIKVLSTDDVLKGLRSGSLAIRETFMRVSWRRRGASYESYSPCRYINFPDAGHSDDYYLQPISGYVLFPHENDILVAYVACCVNGSDDAVIEFCARRYRNVFDQFLAMVAFEDGSEAPIRNLAKTLPIMAAQFDFVVPVKGQCVFYAY